MSTETEHGHTPGPWREYAPAIWNDAHTEKVVDEEYRYVEAGKGYITADPATGFSMSGKVRQSDTRLIAAAPELLKALEDILNNAGISTGEWVALKYVRQAEAAIKKARGE